MAETYSIHITCDNCDHNGTAEIPKGQTVPSQIECPNCGCKTARKQLPHKVLSSWVRPPKIREWDFDTPPIIPMTTTPNLTHPYNYPPPEIH